MEQKTHWIRSEKKAVKSMHWFLSDFRGNGKESFTMLQRRSAMADCWDWCPKKNLPNYSEFYEMRHFEPANEELDYIEYPGEEEQEWIPFGMQQIFYCPQMEGLTVAAEICEDLWVPQPPSITHAIAGANC